MEPGIATRMQYISPFYVMELLQLAKQLERQGRDVIHMEIGEPDFPTPKGVLEAGRQCLHDGQIKYTAATGLQPLREAIGQYYFDRYRIQVAVERIFITPGATGAFLLALGSSLNPGEEIIMADPCYPCNNNFVRLFGGTTQYVKATAETNFQLNAELIRHHWNEHSKGVVVASPSNPTGTLISPDDLKQSVEQTLALKGCFYSDEIYHGLVYKDKAVSALQFSDKAFVINSFSKFFGMTGWRVGWLVVPEAFIDPVEKLAQNIFISTPTQSQYAALACFSRENLEELDRRAAVFAERKDYLYKRLIELGFEVEAEPQGAFYIYANCSRYTDDTFKFAKDLLLAEAVAVTPGKDFGHNRENLYIRFAYTASVDRMSAALDRLEQFLCQYPK